MIYDFAVIGPNPTQFVQVPMMIQYQGLASASGPVDTAADSAVARLRITLQQVGGGITCGGSGCVRDPVIQAGGDILNKTWQADNIFLPTSGGPGILSLTFNMLANIAGTVSMEARVSTDKGGTSDVSLDPVFTIDPVWLLTHSGYSIVASSGIGNEAGVADVAAPEPATLAIFGSGLLGLATLRRSRVRRDRMQASAEITSIV
jgi:hypothetical protein